jgi:hypothetical protein
MPRYVIERQFLVPIYEHVLVGAPSLEDACSQAVDDGALPWGDHSTICYDGAGPVTVARAVEIPDAMLPELRADHPSDTYELSRLSYVSGLEPLEILPEFTDEAPVPDPPGFV